MQECYNLDLVTNSSHKRKQVLYPMLRTFHKTCLQYGMCDTCSQKSKAGKNGLLHVSELNINVKMI